MGDGTYTQITFQVPQRAAGTATVIQGQQSVQLPYVRASWGRLRTAAGMLLAQHASDWRFVTPADPPQPNEWIVTTGYCNGSRFIAPIKLVFATLVAGLCCAVLPLPHPLKAVLAVKGSLRRALARP